MKLVGCCRRFKHKCEELPTR